MVDYTIFSQNTQRKKSVGEGGSNSHSDVFEQRFVTPIKNVMQYNPPTPAPRGGDGKGREGGRPHTGKQSPISPKNLIGRDTAPVRLVKRNSTALQRQD